MGKNWLLYLLGLGAAVVFHTYYFGWYSWFILVLAVCLPWFYFLVSLLAMIRVRLYLEVPDRCFREESAYVTMRAANGFLPMPKCRFRLKIESVMTGETALLPQQTTGQGSWYLPLNTVHCGVLRCTTEKGRVYDYLGLFRLRVRREGMRSLMVRPRPVAMDEPPDLNRYLAKGWRPKPGGGFAENHELRLYRPGDNLRQIHWKLTAKTGKLILRESMKPERGKAILTLDLNGSMEELDRKMGQLLWLSRYLLDMEVAHEIYALTGNGVSCCRVNDEPSMYRAVDSLLWEPVAKSGSIQDRKIPASWACHIGGKTDEA